MSRIREGKVDEIPAYGVADLRMPYATELHKTPTSLMADWVVGVVEVESPVHVEDVMRRIADAAASVSRIGNRIRAKIESGCAWAERTGRVRRAGDFLWISGMENPPIRDRSRLPDASRKHERLAPEEVRAAVRKVVADAFGMEKADIPAAVLRLLLGFKRTSEEAHGRIADIVGDMLAEGVLFDSGGTVVEKPPPKKGSGFEPLEL